MRYCILTALTAGFALAAGASVRAGDVTAEEALAKIKQQKESRLPESDARPAFAVVATDTALDNAAIVKRILSGGTKPLSAITVPSLKTALASKADVIVLLSPVQLKEGDAETREALKQSKLIGIGAGASLFDQLEMEINSGNCAHGRVTKILVQKSKLLGDAPPWKSLQVLGAAFSDIMYIPRKSHLSSVVDVIARVEGDENYAAVVRQGNYVRVGMNCGANSWNDELKEFIHTLAVELRNRKLESFSKARWEITKPGTYEFLLAKKGDSVELPSRSFFFQFTKPTKFSARLKHKGSSSMMLMLYGPRYQRQDAENGQDLEINIEISAADIERRKGGYWELGVTNFDFEHTAQCALKIEYPKR